jgi:hypothetical protein
MVLIDFHSAATGLIWTIISSQQALFSLTEITDDLLNLLNDRCIPVLFMSAYATWQRALEALIFFLRKRSNSWNDENSFSLSVFLLDRLS